jgi:hypothetical protein
LEEAAGQPRGPSHEQNCGKKLPDCKYPEVQVPLRANLPNNERKRKS